jgi:hypothetical protein
MLKASTPGGDLRSLSIGFEAGMMSNLSDIIGKTPEGEIYLLYILKQMNSKNCLFLTIIL